eukprot:TRINITY_DN15541_c0_g1_i1.p1 TRINITY_DN15541_c0_g1~~TRINITY_DN15541_c0_g1_i1.p1  ORF type:complete len:128 (+),score=13.06 TRINITY_DN15541_c0_g1_i1:456-839(+)
MLSSGAISQTPTERLDVDMKDSFGDICTNFTIFYKPGSKASELVFEIYPPLIIDYSCRVDLEKLPAKCTFINSQDAITIYQVDVCPDESTFCGPNCCSQGTFCSDISSGDCCSIGKVECGVCPQQFH